MTKSEILQSLMAFASQRPGLDTSDYFSTWRDTDGRRAYAADARAIARDLHDVRELMAAVVMRESIGVDQLRQAFRAFSGRLTLTEAEKGVALDYCTGQYFPTEYRKAVCAVLAAALWDFWRECAPENAKGDYIRKQARDNLGRGLAARWF
jgi:hypothetical protein